MNGKRSSRTRKLMGCSIAVVLVLFAVIAAQQLDRTMLIRSDSAGIEYEMKDNLITCISVKGIFPYSRILCPHERKSVQDASGNVIEIVDTYTMTAELSLLGRSAVSMKLDIDTSDDAVLTYILKFADGDMKIVNGKVVDAP